MPREECHQRSKFFFVFTVVYIACYRLFPWLDSLAFCGSDNIRRNNSSSRRGDRKQNLRNRSFFSRICFPSFFLKCISMQTRKWLFVSTYLLTLHFLLTLKDGKKHYKTDKVKEKCSLAPRILCDSQRLHVVYFRGKIEETEWGMQSEMKHKKLTREEEVCSVFIISENFWESFWIKYNFLFTPLFLNVTSRSSCDSWFTFSDIVSCGRVMTQCASCLLTWVMTSDKLWMTCCWKVELFRHNY